MDSMTPPDCRDISSIYSGQSDPEGCPKEHIQMYGIQLNQPGNAYLVRTRISLKCGLEKNNKQDRAKSKDCDLFRCAIKA